MNLLRKLVAGIAGSFLVAGAASAADIAPIIPPPPPPMIPAPIVSPFAGLYVGNAFGITLAEGLIFTDAAVVGFNFVNGRRIIGIEGKIGVGPLFDGGVVPFVATSVHAGVQIGQRAQVYAAAGAGYIFGPGEFFATAGAGAEFLIGDHLGIVGEARAIKFFVGAPVTAQFNIGINWHL